MSKEFERRRNSYMQTILDDLGFKGLVELEGEPYNSIVLAASNDLARKSLIQEAVKERRGNIIPFPIALVD